MGETPGPFFVSWLTAHQWVLTPPKMGGMIGQVSRTHHPQEDTVTSATATTETPDYMKVLPISKAIARKVEAAGLTVDVTMDGLGRYHAGVALIWKSGSSWSLISDTGQWAPRTLTVAFELAARLNEQRAAMTAKLTAMTPDALQALILDPTADYTEVQHAMHLLYTTHGWKTLKTPYS